MAPKRPHEDVGGGSSKERKKQRITQARTIDTQPGQGFGVVANTSSGLPSAIDIEKFTEARSFEISAMQSARESVEGNATQRVWQTLPRSLRRRAASHDVRRVPVRLREKARTEMDTVKRKVLNKRLSKAGMSKAISKTQQYLNRQRDKTWLETHIWHAKRMHMKNLWGYRLAETPTEKSYRPSHRSSVHSSILHDASYFGTISISGNQPVLERLLNGCCDCQGSSPGAVRYSLGSRAQDTHLYKWRSYPFDLIAPITIIWKPFSIKNEDDLNLSNTEKTKVNNKKNVSKKGKEKEVLLSLPTDPSTKRTLWIRVHPSAWKEVWDTLKEASSYTVNEIRKEQEKDAEQNSTTIQEESIDLVDLRSSVNCFEIMGPRSSQVLKGVLSAIDQEEREIFHQFWSQLRDVQTPAAVPRGMVIGFKVNDPRLGFPPKNAKAAILKDNAMPSTSQPVVFSVAPSVSLAQSELWGEVERHGGPLRPRFRKKDLDDRRRQNLVPGTHLWPQKQDDRIPLLLMQRSICSQSSNTIPARSSPVDSMHIHGWSLFFPAHWSMAFFTSLTHTGTRVGGLRERRTQVFESGLPDFPFDYPCTIAYEQEAALSAQAEKEAWERKPPAKRVEWGSVDTRSPWRADWEVVLGFSSQLDPDPASVSDPDLLRTQREPERTQHGRMWLLRGVDVRELVHSIAHTLDPGSALLDELNRYRNKRSLASLALTGGVLLEGALVPVKLTICGCGAPNDLAAIYDIDPDEADKIRRLLSGKQAGDIYGDTDQKLSELTAENNRIIGYVTTGNYSLSRGQGLAIGTISLSRFITIVLKEKQHHVNSYPFLVKIKDRNSLNCRVATIQILSS
ncbi:hypothetical protein Clacol_007552 [Clathrus columnatus]|uniref:Uncharacterized protein n=1 Tax=Clathrus columnatus TaxID=1419009 RepID=A0AAV5AN01_9AGAM|nr:hypothetical protein Clacol_007552 [Clathrus columnatus]